MTGRARIFRTAALLLVALLLFVVCLYSFFPSGSIDTLIAGKLAPQGLKLSPAVHKTVLPGLAWDNAVLASAQGELLQCRKLQARPLLLLLLLGRAAFSVAATIGSGHLGLEYALNGTDALELSADGLTLADIPFFKTILGARAGGLIWSRGALKRGPKGLSGDFKLEITRLEFSGVTLGAFPLPDVSGLKAQGLVRVTHGVPRLESFTLAGEGVYMRLSGDLPSGANAAVKPLALTLEIMPKPEFLEKQKLVFLLLARFMASPGVYRLPIRGTLLKPEIL